MRLLVVGTRDDVALHSYNNLIAIALRLTQEFWTVEFLTARNAEKKWKY